MPARARIDTGESFHHVTGDTAALRELALRFAFGLRFRLPDYLIELYKQLRNELPAFNGDDSWTLPMPGRFVIGPEGIIRYAEVNPDYTQRPEPADMLPSLRGYASVAAE